MRPGIPEFMRDRAVPAATIITPNQFELEYLANRTSRIWNRPWPRWTKSWPAGRAWYW